MTKPDPPLASKIFIAFKISSLTICCILKSKEETRSLSIGNLSIDISRPEMPLLSISTSPMTWLNKLLCKYFRL